MPIPALSVAAPLPVRVEGSRAEHTGYLVGALLILSGGVHFAILMLSGGSWEGPLSWRKPAAFGVSFGLTLVTIVWVSRFVTLSERARARLLGAFTIACAIETLLVSIQTWRGVPSHFNTETTIDAIIARVLALGGLVLIVVIVTLTIASFRRNPSTPISMHAAIRAGFTSLLAAQILGGLMIARGMRLVFAGQPQTAYATGGILKPAHAMTMHAIQLLPMLAWGLSLINWPERRRLTVVMAVAAAYLAIAAATIAINLRAY
jgi:hypothetical protein